MIEDDILALALYVPTYAHAIHIYTCLKVYIQIRRHYWIDTRHPSPPNFFRSWVSVITLSLLHCLPN